MTIRSGRFKLPASANSAIRAQMVRSTGLEPAQAEAHYPLKVACLPFHHDRMNLSKNLVAAQGIEPCSKDFQSFANPSQLDSL